MNKISFKNYKFNDRKRQISHANFDIIVLSFINLYIFIYFLLEKAFTNYLFYYILFYTTNSMRCILKQLF